MRIDHPPDDIRLIRTSVHIVMGVIMTMGGVRHSSLGMSVAVENNDMKIKWLRDRGN